MSVDPARRVANKCARLIAEVRPEGRAPALVCVVLVNEADNGSPLLRIDASTHCSPTRSARAAEIAGEYARRLRQAIEDVARSIASEHGESCERRIDIERALANEDKGNPEAAS